MPFAGPMSRQHMSDNADDALHQPVNPEEGAYWRETSPNLEPHSTSFKMTILETLYYSAELTLPKGKGDYYCSGNDLNNATQAAMDGAVKGSRNSIALFKSFVKCFIDFPKPLIAVVNGPAVGVAVTVLGLCDIVYATERATFHTPFTQLGMNPEGCASYTFPKIMGYAKELLRRSVLATFKGKGDYYCSGNDLNNATQAAMDGAVKGSRNSIALFKSFVKCFIDFPKPLIAVVNGPAVGVAVTVLGLCDIVYATERATFHTPFTQLGMNPEGCASYTFPKIMGYAKANEMLLFSKKLTAKEACDQGLVTEVFPDSTFQKQVWARVNAYAQFPRQSLTFSKQLVRGLEKEKLHAVNSQECEGLLERATSDESRNAILSFFKKKSKL